MCGLLAYFSTDADRVDDATVDGGARRPSTACATAAPTRTRPGGTTGRCSASTGCRSSTSSTATSRCPTPTAGTGSSSTARSTTTWSCASRAGRRGRRRSRPRATPRRSSPATTSGARTSSTRLRGMFAFVIWDTETRHGLRRPRPVRHQAAVHHPAGRRRDSSSAPRRRRCSSCSAAARPPAASTRASLQHYLTLQYVPEPATLHRGIRRIESGTSFTVVDGELHTKRYFHPTFPIRPVREGRAAGALRPDRRRPRRLGARCTCAPTSPSAPSSPAASTPPPSPRWPSGTTRS